MGVNDGFRIVDASINPGQWKKGQSGNPKGRPRAERALANVLRDTGDHDSFGDLPNKALMARMVWQAVAMGEITLVGGRTLTLSNKEWLDLVKWLNFHVDGSFHAQGESSNSSKPDAPDPNAAPQSAANILMVCDMPDGTTRTLDDVLREYRETHPPQIKGINAPDYAPKLD